MAIMSTKLLTAISFMTTRSDYVYLLLLKIAFFRLGPFLIPEFILGLFSEAATE